MHHASLRPALAAAVLICVPALSRAQDADSQGWLQILFNKREANGMRYFGELQQRVGNNWQNPTIAFVRGAVGKQLSPEFSLWLGYAWTPQQFPEWRGEDRYFLQGQWERKYGSWTTIQRTRFELRNIEDTGGSTYRLRHFIRATTPFSAASKHFFALQAEAFYNVERTGGIGPRPGYDQTRLYLGVGTNLSKNVRLEAGYQPVWLQIPSRRRLDTLLVVANFTL